jgi:ribosome-binding protein aMBF1 (putative translation factor)
MQKSNGHKHVNGAAQAPLREDESVPSEEEIAQILADMDDPSKWSEEDVVLGPGFYRAPQVARQLAEFVASYRTERGLTRRQLARETALDESLIEYIESGEHTPELETLVRLARHLGMSFTVHIDPSTADLSVEVTTGTATPA